MAPPPPALMDELVEEILLRLSPDDPASLVRAALVCRRWCLLVSDTGFRRRFRMFHRTPPMLGVFHHIYRTKVSTFVPITSCPTISDRCNWQVVDARHGRVLLQGTESVDPRENHLAVWDPITNVQTELPSLPEAKDCHGFNGSVLCANNNTCDHLDCNGGPFLVVLVVTKALYIFVYTYSLETCVWSELASGQQSRCQEVGWYWQPTVPVDNTLYVMSRWCESILQINLSTRKMSVIGLPSSCHYNHIVLTTTEAGGIGYAIVKDFKLYLWSIETSLDQYVRWARCKKVIDLMSLLPARGYSRCSVVAFVDGVSIFLLSVNDDVFTFDLKSGQVRKVYQNTVQRSLHIFPYMSFYTPALGAASSDARTSGPRT